MGAVTRLIEFWTWDMGQGIKGLQNIHYRPAGGQSSCFYLTLQDVTNGFLFFFFCLSDCRGSVGGSCMPRVNSFGNTSVSRVSGSRTILSQLQIQKVVLIMKMSFLLLFSFHYYYYYHYNYEPIPTRMRLSLPKTTNDTLFLHITHFRRDTWRLHSYNLQRTESISEWQSEGKRRSFIIRRKIPTKFAKVFFWQVSPTYIINFKKY